MVVENGGEWREVVCMHVYVCVTCCGNRDQIPHLCDCQPVPAPPPRVGLGRRRVRDDWAASRRHGQHFWRPGGRVASSDPLPVAPCRCPRYSDRISRASEPSPPRCSRSGLGRRRVRDGNGMAATTSWAGAHTGCCGANARLTRLLRASRRRMAQQSGRARGS